MTTKSKQLFNGNRLLKSSLGGFSLALAGAWLIIANLGCGTWQLLNTFFIELSPEVFLADVPGRAGTVRATLKWAYTRDLEAKTWSVDPALPEIVFGASCSPTTESIFTDVYVTTSPDLGKFKPSDLWVASANNTYSVGIKATFVDPLWKSLSEGQEAVIARKKFLPIKTMVPEPYVVLKTHRGGWYSFIFEVRNPAPNYKYYYSRGSYDRERFNAGEGKTLTLVPLRESYITFTLTAVDISNTVVRAVRETFFLKTK